MTKGQVTMNTKTKAPHTFTCGWCERDFSSNERTQLGAANAWRNVYCSNQCRNANNNSKSYIHVLGPCPNCGKMFKSRSKNKLFCCMKCYTSSPEFKSRMQSYNEKKRLAPRECPQCGTLVQHKKNKYCSNACRRLYFAERFDRWVANPEKIALPQNFDEFMSKSKLPCLVEGCDWEGAFLGQHVNIAHGITADNFRELVGFNHGTGLVGIDLHLVMSEHAKQMIEDGTWSPGTPPELRDVDRSIRKSPRLEAREHMLKAGALNAGKKSQRGPLPCRHCNTPVEQNYYGQILYCSTRCRSAYYRNQGRAELHCDYCGDTFMARTDQLKRAKNDQKVCCSLECRNHMNMAACLAARGIQWSAK